MKKRHNQVSEFPFDAVRVELKFPGGSMTAIDTIARILMHVFLDCSVSFSSHKKSAFPYFWIHYNMVQKCLKENTSSVSAF